MATLSFPHDLRQRILPYLPPQTATTTNTANSEAGSRPFVTLTYAQSLDGQISLLPGQPTALSGSASKAMTHYLRSVHDAILVGSGTALADDPGLNCRLEDVVSHSTGLSESSNRALSLKGQPRPVVLDRRGRWKPNFSSKVVKLARQGTGKGPWIIVSEEAFPRTSQDCRVAVGGSGGWFCNGGNASSLDFPRVLTLLAQNGIKSVMVEGGGNLINDILANHQDCVDSLIITIAPVFLGAGGVAINPERHPMSLKDTDPAVRTRDMSYLTLDQDVVLCARPEQKSYTR